jgi:serine/threonine protein kinase/tetratricopeptide (TPR) repeat protein
MIGKIINDRYRIDAEIGAGGMGTVYQGFDLVLQRPVAVKVLIAKSGMGTQGRARLLSEAQSIAQLDHPNIVTVHDAGETEGIPFIVMQHVSGVSLRQVSATNLVQTLTITRQLCQALQHAHSQHIVHRDLKPENVLITNLPSDMTKASGDQTIALDTLDLDLTVMLMDFGLARSEDLLAQTQDRSFLGTIAYISPEQALGNPVDGRSDLYSLGVMLYELVAGRLPFNTEDPIAMISQHLHAPVVPPSAYNEEIPAALDTLIQRMLNKEPDRRPASAEEILAVIEGLFAVHPTSLSAPSLSPLERLVRGQLIGRERELSHAINQWHKVQSGESAVLLVSGEPGIGKTRLVREIVAHAKVAGAQTLSGECYPEGGLPYAPISQIIDTAISSNGYFTSEGKELPNIVLADLITLTPTLVYQFPGVPPNPPLDPLAEQQRLFESMVYFCRAISEQAPVLIVLEDAHWADHGTLAMLRHISRRAAHLNLRLLLVLTYREVELAEQRALNEVLADFHRERLAERIKLSRLNRDQTRDMLAVLFQDEITPELLEGIYQETEGNPFFIEEVCKALIDEGKIYREEGSWQRLDMTEIHIPQSVRLTIERRVRYLPREVRDPLVQAAILGRIFDFDTLRDAIDIDEDALMEALEQAERAQLIEETGAAGGGTFSFSHALIPSTLTEELSGLRRRRMHQRAAQAIQELQPENYETLAHHFAEAADDERARQYYMQAGLRARSRYANQDAIQYFTLALELTESDDQGRFDLLASRASIYELTAQRDSQLSDVQAMLDLAEKLDNDTLLFEALIAQADFYLATEHIRSQDPLERALSLARKLNDQPREGQTLRRKGGAARKMFDNLPARRYLENAIQIFRETGMPDEETASLIILIPVLRELGDQPGSITTGEQAILISKRTGDRRQLAEALLCLAGTYLSVLDEDNVARDHAEAALTIFQEIGDKAGECSALNTLAITYHHRFDISSSEAYYLQSLEIAEAISDSLVIGFVTSNLLLSVFLPRGRQEGGLNFLQEMKEKAELRDDRFLIDFTSFAQVLTLDYLGRYESALKLLSSIQSRDEEIVGHSMYVAFQALSCCFYLLCDQEENALKNRQEVLKFVKTVDQIDEARARTWNYLAKSALLIGEKDVLQQGLEFIKSAISFHKQVTDFLMLADGLTISAQLHLALFEIDGDRTHLDQAFESSSEAVQLPEQDPEACHLDEYCYTHARVLKALGHDDEVEPYLRKAFDRVIQVANNIEDENLRRSWLENVAIHREILAEASSRGWIEN